MIFDDQEEAEKAYLDMSTVLMEVILQHQLMTTWDLGIIEALTEKIKTKGTHTDSERMELTTMVAIVNQRTAEVRQYTDMVHDTDLPLPQIDIAALKDKIAKIKKESKRLAAVHFNTDGRNQDMKTLMDAIRSNEAQLGDIDE